MSSIFAKHVTATHDFVCVPGQSFTVRKLTGEQLAECRSLHGTDVVAWAFKVMEYGLTAWSYEEAITEESRRGLIDEAVDEITTAVLKLTKPAAFVTDEKAAEAEQKND